MQYFLLLLYWFLYGSQAKGFDIDMKIEDTADYKALSDIEKKAVKWLHDNSNIEVKGKRMYLDQYAEGYLDGIEFCILNGVGKK